MGIFERRKLATSNMDNTMCLVCVVALLLTFISQAYASEPRVVCYYTNWSVYRPGTAKFNPQNINPYLCTHLIYAFGGFTKDNTLKPFDKYQDIEKGGYAKFTGLKTYNKNLKTMLAIGGWNEGSTRFSPMVAARDRRKEFVRNAIRFLRQNHFDGLDLDWEYPAFRDGGKPKDRENYSKLVKELREEFDREAQKTGKPRLLLTMAVPAGIEYVQKGFDVKTLNQYLDWMNLLTYDYHSAFEPAVNHHAPLYPLEEPNEYSVDNELNIDYTIKFYLESGADRDKLVLGIPTYGRSYTLFNPDATDIGAPADGPGEQGDATREKGYLAYYEICEALKPKVRKAKSVDSEESGDDSDEEEEDEEWTIKYPNPKAMGPVAFRNNQWVGYDDVDIVRKKADYVAENALGGIMFWSIDNDDFRGNCHGKPYPLIEAAKEAYISKLGATDNVIVSDRPKPVSLNSSRRKNRPKSSTTERTTTAASRSSQESKRKSSSTTPSWSANTPEPPTTPDPGSDFKCVDEGFYQHPRDCKKYFWCLDSGPSNLGIVAHQFTCPSGLFFNKAADSCDFARNVHCKKPAATTKAPATSKPSTTRASTTTTTTESSSTRRSIKLSTRNSLLFRTTSTTSTAAPAEDSSEEQDEEDAHEETDASDVDAEDPKVIKELIDLIRKVGGVEQLEKHLHLAETSMATDSAGTTTPANLKKKLYQKVLEKTLIKNILGTGPEKYPGSQNSRRGPQYTGSESTGDGVNLRKDRPQYTTINRSRPSTTTEESAESREEEENTSAEEKERAQAVRYRDEDSDVRVGGTAKPLQYVNIRRARPTTISTSDTAHDTASRNGLFERNEPYIKVSETPSSFNTINAKRESVPEYVTIRRQRPSTEETTTIQYENTELGAEQSESIETSSPSTAPQPQYSSIARTRPTTESPSSLEPINTPEPTTVLAVQISSLLNSPAESPSKETPVELEVTSSRTTVETEPSVTTTTAASRTSTTRRTAFKRRGSTTSTSTTAPTTAPATTQAAKRQRPNFLRRPKPTAPSASPAPPAPPAPPTDTAAPPDNDLTTEFSTIVENTTSKYTRRGQSRFKTRNATDDEREVKVRSEPEPRRRPSLAALAQRSESRKPARAVVRRRLGGANVTASTTEAPVRSSTSRRPFRVASRRRPVLKPNTTITTSTTAAPADLTTVVSEEYLQDIDDKDSVEEGDLKPRRVPGAAARTVKVQRRPLTSLKQQTEKELKDQNPSASTDEESKRQSKKYSSTFKQNQLDEVIRQKSRSQEVTDGPTGSTANFDDISAETAVAIATHQLLAAPLPSTVNFDYEPKTTTKKEANPTSHSTLEDTYSLGYTDPYGYENAGGITANKVVYSSTPLVSGYSSTPSYASTSRSPIPSVLPKLQPSSIYPTGGVLSNSVGYSGVSQPQLGPSTARYLGTSDKYLSIPVEEFGYSTEGYVGGLSREPVYFTREYLLESPVTKTYDEEYQYLSPVTLPQTTTRKAPKKIASKKISTTQRPTTIPGVASPATTAKPRRAPQRKPFEKVAKSESKKTYRPIENYDYYDDSDEKLVGKYEEGTQVVVHAKGRIECLDIGNFPHPVSCKKFISCARMESGAILGWEYVCPKGLSFDPVGGICNWSAGLGCDEK